MRRFLYCLLITTLLAPCALVAGSSQPAPSKPAVAKRLPDDRLAQKVTYTGGYKRLHAVADELSATTGVTIRCGNDANDWQVRDIPVFVHVKDISLGRLLSSLADAAHVQLTAEQTGSGETDKRLRYRLARTKKGEQELSNPMEQKAEAETKLAVWAWDALAAYGNAPNLPLPKSSPGMTCGPEQIRLVSRIFASMTAEQKQRAFDGWSLKLRMKDPQGSLLKELFRLAWDDARKNGEVDRDCTEQDYAIEARLPLLFPMLRIETGTGSVFSVGTVTFSDSH